MLICSKCEKETEPNPELGLAPDKFCDACPDGVWQVKDLTSAAASTDPASESSGGGETTILQPEISAQVGESRLLAPNTPHVAPPVPVTPAKSDPGTAAGAGSLEASRVSEPSRGAQDGAPVLPTFAEPKSESSVPVQLQVSLGRGDLKPGQQMVVRSTLRSRGLVAGSCRIKMEYNEQLLQEKQIQYGTDVFSTLTVPNAGQHLLRFEVRVPGRPFYEGYLTFDCDGESGPKIVIHEEINGQDIVDGQYGDPIELPPDFKGTVEIKTVMNANGDVMRTSTDPRVRIGVANQKDRPNEQIFNVSLHEVLQELSVAGELPQTQQPYTPTITLSVPGPDQLPRLITLNAGTQINIGRRPKLKPRLFLRNSKEYDPREYFRDVHSNHGFIQMNEAGAHWQNGDCSAAFVANYQGTLINGSRFSESGQRIPIKKILEITPCGAVSDDEVPNAPDKDDYNLRIPRLRLRAHESSGTIGEYASVARSYGLTPPATTEGPRSAVCIDRLGEVEGLESHVLMQNVAELGSDPTASIVIDDPSVQPFHATVVTFHGCFWIRPKSDNCHVEAFDTPLQRDQIAWLKPGTVLVIGGVRVTVSEFRQHNVPT